MSRSGISWAVCKSAPGSRQITTPATHHSVFYRPDALLPPNRQCQITEGISFCKLVSKLLESFCSRAMPKQRSPLLCGLLWRTICFRFTCYWSLSAFSAWTLLVGHHEDRPACKKWVMRCWCGYLPGTKCRFFCIWSSWLHCNPKPHHILPRLIQTGFTLPVPAYPGCPGKEAVKWVL